MTRECSVIWRPDPKSVEGEGKEGWVGGLVRIQGIEWVIGYIFD